MLDKYQGIFCWPRPVPCYDAVPLVFWGFLASLGTAVMGGRSRILDPGFLSVTKQGQSLSSWGVGVFLCSFVSQSPGAVQTWMEHGGFPGGLEGLSPCFLLREGVCSHNGKAGHQFYLGCELWQGEEGRKLWRRSFSAVCSGTLLGTLLCFMAVPVEGCSVLIHCLS